MDYVEWCDAIAGGIAIYVEHQPNHWINLHSFAHQFLEARHLTNDTTAEHAVILDAKEMLTVCGAWKTAPSIQLKYADLDCLRDHYRRWVVAQGIPCDAVSRQALQTLNRLSQRHADGYTTVAEIDLNAIAAAFKSDWATSTIDAGHLMEVLDGLVRRGLAYGHKATGLTEYKSSYLGVACTHRAQVATDLEIDQLRTAGEGDTLDYKRHYKLATNPQKWEFTKDVTALANAGGAGSRRLLLGVEDTGEFYRPSSADEAQEHRDLLASLSEERLQQIVTSRTTHAPSLRIAARGEHRDGPYVLVEVTRNVSHVPYRIFRDQAERTAPNAHELGEVWVRKGSTKALATPAEIAALEQQADLYLRIHHWESVGTSV